MSRWETYLHGDAPDRLVQLAILHAEFEAIHPFMDGNGRMGRLLVPLFLVDKGLLSRPNFYLSAYLERFRDGYYDHLLAVSRDGDWTGWCVFFLTAIIEQARENSARASRILDLYRKTADRLSEASGSKHALRAVAWLFREPIFRATSFVDSAGIPASSAHRILSIAQRRKILRTIVRPSGRRPGILCFSELLIIAEGRSVF